MTILKFGLMQYISGQKKAGDKIANYLITHYKDKYRLKVEYDRSTNDFPRKLNGNYEDIDVFIDCRYGNRIYSLGRGILYAYIPSIIRGHNITKTIFETTRDKSIIYDIEETDKEILFKFNAKDDDKIIPLLNPKTSGAGISPFSTKNLPKSDYIIPEKELIKYNDIIKDLPQQYKLQTAHITNAFIKSLVTKKNTIEDIKADMKLKCMNNKQYIHCIGKWDEYIKYLQTELENRTVKIDNGQ